MAYFYEETSHTFSEYLLVPGYSSKDCIPDNVSLQTPVVKFKKGEKPALSMNIPLVSAIMQSVSDNRMAVALAREGGISFIYSSQPIGEQADMIRKVKAYKAGFVKSDSNIRPDQTLTDLIALKNKTGHSTTAVTADGSASGELVGIVTSRDYRVSRMAPDTKISDIMTKLDDIVYAKVGISLSEANDMIWESKINVLPILDNNRRLDSFVFRKDYEQHKENSLELLDNSKSYIVGAGINTRDYEERVPALIDAGADILCIDSSEGFTEWQKITLSFIREKYGSTVKVGAGNVVDKDGFRYLVDAGADFVKIGIGGGAICTTREVKGIGRGQATAVIEVAKARDEYFKETGIYVPICSDGGIVYDYHIALALAMGSDFCMLGRYFARFDESPAGRVMINGTYMKEYWGEGSSRARNWQRYNLSSESSFTFEEGVDSLVPYAGSLRSNVGMTISKIKATMCNCGALTIKDLQENARISLVSSVSIIEGGTHDVLLRDSLGQRDR